MMTRQTTISYNGQHYMFDVAFERKENTTIYHIAPNANGNVNFPKNFSIVKPDDSDQPEYDTQELTGEGKEIAEVIWKQIQMLPAQFKGGAGKGNL
jgi:hypothetical protein